MYGVSQDTVSVDDIEKYSLNEEARAKHILDIKQFCGVEEVVVMSTEFRNEYYLHVNETTFKHGDLLRYLSEFTEKPLKEVILETYSKFNEDVIRHLYSLASGMDAVPKGTINTLRSTENALSLSKRENTIGFVLKGLFEKAIEYAREIRILPQVAPLNQVEVSQSIRIMQEQLSGLQNKKFVLFGHGYEVIHLAKTLLYAEASSVTVANDNYQKSLDISDELNNWNICNKGNYLRKVHLADLNVAYRLSSADGIIVSSSINRSLLTQDLFSAISEMRHTKKMQVIVDLSYSQEKHLIHQNPTLHYYNVGINNGREYSKQQIEQAILYFDESLLHATDRFMEAYHQFIDRREITSIFTKRTSDVGG